MNPTEYVRLLSVAREALTTARKYAEQDGTWRPAFADLWMLDTLTSQSREDGDDWWPVGGAVEAMVAVVEAGRCYELVPGDMYEFVDEDITNLLSAVGRYGHVTDEEVAS